MHPMSDLLNQIRERLQATRNLAEVARKAGVNYYTVRRIAYPDKAGTKNPRVDTVTRIAAALDL